MANECQLRGGGIGQVSTSRGGYRPTMNATISECERFCRSVPSLDDLSSPEERARLRPVPLLGGAGPGVRYAKAHG